MKNRCAGVCSSVFRYAARSVVRLQLVVPTSTETGRRGSWVFGLYWRRQIPWLRIHAASFGVLILGHGVEERIPSRTIASFRNQIFDVSNDIFSFKLLKADVTCFKDLIKENVRHP